MKSIATMGVFCWAAYFCVPQSSLLTLTTGILLTCSLQGTFQHYESQSTRRKFSVSFNLIFSYPVTIIFSNRVLPSHCKGKSIAQDVPCIVLGVFGNPLTNNLKGGIPNLVLRFFMVNLWSLCVGNIISSLM